MFVSVFFFSHTFLGSQNAVQVQHRLFDEHGFYVMNILGKKSIIPSLPIKYGDVKMDNLKVSYQTYYYQCSNYEDMVKMLTAKSP